MINLSFSSLRRISYNQSVFNYKKISCCYNFPLQSPEILMSRRKMLVKANLAVIAALLRPSSPYLSFGYPLKQYSAIENDVSGSLVVRRV